MREWFTTKEIAGLPGLPSTVRGVLKTAKRDGWKLRKRVKGKGLEYHLSNLPETAQAALLLRHSSPASPAGGPVITSPADGGPPSRLASAPLQGGAPAQPYEPELVWQRFNALPGRLQNTARERLAAVQAGLALIERDIPRRRAWQIAAQEAGVARGTVQRWHKRCSHFHHSDWLAALAPDYRGCDQEAELTPEAWDYLASDYLRPEAPGQQACIERLRQIASDRGWQIPSDRTLQRRLSDIPAPVRVLAREGAEALRRMYPPQRRRRDDLHALAAVNADGHKFDVMVSWPDGHVGRPILLAWHDVYSGKFLAWRIGKTETSDLVRGAWGDMVTRWGIPDAMVLDNGRGFAAKFLTGGTATRYRFKVQANDPIGIFTQMGVDIHWAEPGHGQSKPVERAFGDVTEHIARHPLCAGAYVGNNPDAKPENYGSRAVPIEEFQKLVAAQIAWLNAKTGRRGGVCQGRSFDQVFAESYKRAVIRKATESQRRLWLLAAERVKARKPTGEIHLGGNRYWHEALAEHIGDALVVRFDPDQLHAGVIVERLDGRVISRAECIDNTGFIDSAAATEHRRLTGAWRRKHKAALEALKRLQAAELAAELPTELEPDQPDPAPAAKVVQGMFKRVAGSDLEPDTEEAERRQESFQRAVSLMRKHNGSPLD